ncbi:MAG: divergent polysaccharide deacetylase family protein [Candidatus Marinarcus sp.]|uniref:divergent polysaccharide deacetylase family protein n=1 Tax=Candidatus Marinarcus sp. TaxID=3100987 RepID=UPI003AFFDE8E
MTKKRPKTTRKPKKNNNNYNRLKLINYILLILIITLTSTIVGYYFLDTKEVKAPAKKSQKQVKEQDKTFDIFKDEKLTTYMPTIDKEENLTPLEKAFEEYTEELEKEYTHEPATEVTPAEKKPVVVGETPQDKRPKLAIIIDDVTMQSQVNNLNTIDYKINMSFMPPTPHHKNSAKIAQNIPFHMIHFPMQANSFKYEEANTLHIGDSYEKIENRVKKIHELYPNAHFTNNHTGSKFTADDASMDKLFRALKKYNFSFVDSRTTAQTVAKKYAQKYGVPYLARNIFLDNNLEYDYIQKQLKKAIESAKKSGYAIAIGHPHNMTIKVLKESKPLLKDLNIVYINELPVQ